MQLHHMVTYRLMELLRKRTQSVCLQGSQHNVQLVPCNVTCVVAIMVAWWTPEVPDCHIVVFVHAHYAPHWIMRGQVKVFDNGCRC